MSQGWSKIFNRINWLNRPSTNTPLNATNLNAGDSAIDKLDDRIITLDTVKADMQVVNGMVSDVSLNSNTGVITVTYKNGSHVDYDTNLEKIAVNFTYDYSTQRLVLTLSDGSKQYVDMSALITQYEFEDSATIAISINDKTGAVSAFIKNGSITDAMLETGYLAKIIEQAAKATNMANSATTSSNSAYDNAKLSQSYAIGGSSVRDGENTDNAKYYSEQAKAISESFSGALRPMGTVTFANLPSVSSASAGDMYNISDEFVTTSDFVEGSGITEPAGSNVYKTVAGKWDVLAGSPVTGVKGEKEKVFGRGNVNITCASIGALPADGDSKDNTVTFTSNDSTTGDSTAPALLTSGETHASIFSKVSTIFKNVRWLLSKMGTTDISELGDTVTGALSTLNSNIEGVKKHYFTSVFGSAANVVKNVWAKSNKDITVSESGIYIVNFPFLRDQGGVDTAYLTQIKIDTSDSLSSNNEPDTSCVSTNWGITSMTYLCELQAGKTYHIWLRHTASQTHTIDYHCYYAKL